MLSVPLESECARIRVQPTPLSGDGYIGTSKVVAAIPSTTKDNQEDSPYVAKRLSSNVFGIDDRVAARSVEVEAAPLNIDSAWYRHK